MAILSLVHALRQQGVEAEIVTTNDHGTGTLPVPLQQQIQSGTVPELVGPSVPIRFFPRIPSPIAALREFGFAPALTHWLWRQLPQYDLVHVHAIFNYTSLVGMGLARHYGIPYLNRPLGSLCQWSLQQGHWKKQLLLGGVGRRLLQDSQGLHFMSEPERQEATAQGFDFSSFVIPHGITVPAPLPQARASLRHRLNLPKDQPILVFLSRVHPKKGLENLLAALQPLRSQRFTLVIAGSGEASYEAQIDQLIQQQGLKSHVHRLGFVRGEAKDCLLQGADAFVLPSHSENFGLAVLEALAAGLPVVITPGVALAEAVQHHQVGWVTAAEPAVLADCLKQVLADPAQLCQRGNRAREMVERHYSWRCQAMQLQQHYGAIIKAQELPVQGGLSTG